MGRQSTSENLKDVLKILGAVPKGWTKAELIDQLETVLKAGGGGSSEDTTTGGLSDDDIQEILDVIGIGSDDKGDEPDENPGDGNGETSDNNPDGDV